MEPVLDPTAEQISAPVPPAENPTPQFQIDLETRKGNFVIAASDTVNDLVDHAKAWLGATSEGGALLDNDVISITLMEVDPATGEYMGGESIPVESKQDIITQLRNLGGR